MHYICVVRCNSLLITLAVADDVLFRQAILLAKQSTKLDGLPVHLFEVGIIRKPVLADFKTDMRIVGTASGMSSTVIPGKCLIDCYGAVSQPADKSMGTDLSSPGMIGVPMTAVLIFAKQAVIGTDITLEIWVIDTSRMNHDAFDRDFPACLIACIFCQNEFV